eukprot:g18757.t1
MHILNCIPLTLFPLLKPYADKPTEPPFLHRFRKKELLLAIQANKLKKAAGTRKSGRVKIDRSLADFDQESSDDEVITQEKTQEKKKQRKERATRKRRKRAARKPEGRLRVFRS